MLNHGFKVTGLVWVKRVELSSLGIQTEIECFATQPLILLRDKRHCWYQEASGGGGFFVLAADT